MKVPKAITEVPKDWCDGNPVRTHFFNAMSIILPLGEGFFIWSICNFRGLAVGAGRGIEIAGFIAQEANHARLHGSYNHCLTKDGYDVANMERRLRWSIRGSKKRFSHEQNLALTVAMEHITAILGVHILAGTLMRGEIDPTMRELWEWHSREEVEHRDVAMNVFRLTQGTYRHLAYGMILVSLDFWGNVYRSMFHMLNKDGLLKSPKTWWQIASMTFEIVRIFGIETLKFFLPWGRR